MSKKNLKHQRKYTIVVNTYDDNSIQIIRQNKGYSVIELLGMIEVVRANLLNLISDNLNEMPTTRKSTNSPIIHIPTDLDTKPTARDKGDDML